ncbi:phospholipase D family protein [Georgenia muralis]|uniref:PLD phosphodiesterase domain-containing protein n=1 Tax=Georgenia muralis TaxID=154117 RepID=A0A3N4ZU41_9MICO|nr:phospholipase D family protein [Georgenia muralis]RPF29012.1 hypothetical protein EDD32_3563 [Georgenia muralis]
MLGPDDGVTLLEALAPPAGFQLDVAVGTSYTLDLHALLAVPAAFALHRDSGDGAGLTDHTALALLEALRSYAGRITVFTDAGHIALPPTAAGGVFGFLEKTVVPVCAPRGGAFHPKLWALRFADEDGTLLHRLLVASRNLTFDRSWDALVRLDESDGPGVSLAPLTGVVEALVDMPATRVQPSADRADTLRDLARTIGAAQFDLPAGFDTMTLHPFGFRPGSTREWPFPRTSRRTLVVSPFLTAGALRRLEDATREFTVVSRSDELDRTYATRLEPQRPPAFEVNPHLVDVSDDADVLSGLHAKVFAFDVARSRSHVFAGSANATTAAVTQNTEVLLEMVGSTYEVGVRRWLSDDSDPTFQRLLTPHVWGEEPPERSAVLVALDAIRAELARLTVTCAVTADEDGWFTVHYTSDDPLPSHEGAVLWVRPLSEANWTSPETDHLDHTARTPLAGLSSLLGVRVTVGDESIELVLPCAMTGLPADRDDRLLALLIANPDRLVRYLLMLLTDRPDDRFDGALREMQREVRQRDSYSLSTVPLLELLLRAQVRHPERLVAISRLLDVVRSSPELRDDALLELWDRLAELPSLDGPQ